jgi:outer membrane immunogenic protein
MLNKMLFSCAALVSLPGVASAADMYVKAPPPVYVPTWTGCYVGGHAGYGVGTSSSQYSPGVDVLEFGGPAQLNQNFDNKGFSGGGQVGCQLQTGTFLWGLEGDWSSFSNSYSHNFQNFSENGIDSSVNQSVSYSSLWSVRGRFGGIFSDVYHLYVTAGIGGAKASYTSSASFSSNELFLIPSCVCARSATNISLNPTGIVFGAGAEWKIWPSVVVGAEYLHYALPSDTAIPAAGGRLFGEIPISSLVGPGLGDHVHTNGVDVIRVRASYLFNWWGR